MSDKEKQEKLTPAKNVSADILVPRLIFILSVLALVLFGLVMVFSASNVEALNNNESPYSYLIKQIAYGLFGLFFAWLIWRKINYTVWKSWFSWLLFIGLLFCMIATSLFGEETLGAKRWLSIGPLGFQPSEFVKIIIVIILARYLDEFRNEKITFKDFMLFAGLSTLVMLILILGAQKDLGTTMICVVGILGLLYISDVPWYVIAILVGICIFAIIFAVLGSSWRSNRLIFLDPYNDGDGGYGDGYQLIRSYYAFAEGGFFGVGLGNSYEKYQYLPEAETDFIFAIIGEELGFCGCIIVIGLFSALIVSGLMIAMRSQSRFAAGVSGAFVIMIGFQAFLNIMCVIGFAPTTGKPLPFISAGGSSVIATLIMVGFVLAGSEQDSLPDKYEKRRQGFKVSAPVGGGRINVTSADEVLAPKPKSRRTQATNPTSPRPKTTSTSSTVPNKSSATRGVKKTPTIKEPKFISSNDKKRQTNHKSYAYKRDKAAPSFKPRTTSAIKSAPKSSSRTTATKSRGIKSTSISSNRRR